MQNQEIYSVTMDDEKLGVKPEVLVDMYTAIDARARQLAPLDVRKELTISQEGTIKTRFHLQFSSRMMPHLITAIQQQADTQQGIELRSYFYKLQEQVMAQMFGSQEQITTFNIRYEGKLI